MSRRKPIEEAHRHLSKTERERRIAQESAVVRPQGLNRNLRNWWTKALAEFGSVITREDSNALLSYCQARAAKDKVAAEVVAAEFRNRAGYQRPASRPAEETPAPPAGAPPLPFPQAGPDCAEAAKQYARDVLADRIVAGKLLKQACQRFLDDLEEGPSRGIVFDAAAAQHCADYLHRLGLNLMGWQHFVIAALFGFKGADEMRRFRAGFIEVSKKAGKSTLLAGLALYMADLEGDGESNAEVYVAATTKFQSHSICFQAAVRLRESPSVAERSKAYRDDIQFDGGGLFAPLAANSEKLNGLNIHFGILDELADHTSEGLYNVFRTSTVGRRQPLILSITTAGQTRQSIAWEVRAHAEQVLEGVVPDDGFFAFIAELDKDDDPYDEKNWPKCNVSLGVTQHLANLRQLASDAKRIRRTQGDFLRFNMNRWPDKETKESFFKLSVLEKPGNAYLNNGTDHLLSPDKRIAAARLRLKGLPCHAGLDLAICEDLTAFCLLFPPLEEDGIFEVLFDFFCPEESVERRSREQRVPYDVWAREGFITQTPGEVCDFKKVRAVILERFAEFNIVEMGFDVALANDIALDLRDAGMTVTQVKQGAWLDAAIQRMERLFINGKLCHHGHPIAVWNLSNAVVMRNSQNRYRFEKDKSREKIDGAVALACALDRFLSTEKAPTTPYSHRGIIFLDDGGDWDSWHKKKEPPHA
jgi:phage terminase large subunit-like protein